MKAGHATQTRDDFFAPARCALRRAARMLPQLADNLACVKWSLNAKQLAQLDEVSRIELGFPGDFLRRPSVRNFLHGGLFDRIKR